MLFRDVTLKHLAWGRSEFHWPRRLLRRPVVSVRHRGVGDSDVFLAHYPRSGGSWTRLMVTELLLGQEVGFGTTAETIPVIGKHRNAPRVLPDGGRLIKTHEPFRRKYAKAIVVVRDVRDVMVAYYHMFQLGKGYQVPLDDFVDLFVRGRLDGWGPWHEHTRSWVEAADGEASILLIKYEDLRASTAQQLASIGRFLGIDLSGRDLDDIVAHYSIARTKERERRERHLFEKWAGKKGVGLGIVRKGNVGDWRSTLSAQHLRALAPAEPILVRLGYPPLDHDALRTEGLAATPVADRGPS